MKVLLVNGSSRKKGCTNVAWMLKSIVLGKENGLKHPDNEKVLTNFVR